MQITIELLVAEAQRVAANHLAALKGTGLTTTRDVITPGVNGEPDIVTQETILADFLTFGNPAWQDAQGNLYSGCGVQVSDAWLGGLGETPTRPDFDTDEQIDMALALQAYQGMTLIRALPQPGEAFTMPAGLMMFVGTGLPQALGLISVTND